MVGYASTAKNSARAMTFGVAASLALAVAPGALRPAWADSANDAAAARATAGCAKIMAPGAHAQCMYDALGRATEGMKRRIAIEKKRGIDADRQAAEADRRGAEADRRSAEADRRSTTADKRYQSANDAGQCTEFLIAGVKGGTFTKSAVLTFAKGRLTAANACEVARGFGYSQKAELDCPTIR